MFFAVVNVHCDSDDIIFWLGAFQHCCVHEGDCLLAGLLDELSIYCNASGYV